uniref:Ovule protein n=1 Tax=Globodera rostochiensis TaxID=31243 RepID=A0A914HML0_GLORO
MESEMVVKKLLVEHRGKDEARVSSNLAYFSLFEIPNCFTFSSIRREIAQFPPISEHSPFCKEFLYTLQKLEIFHSSSIKFLHW